jgi:hypothetical protein
MSRAATTKRTANWPWKVTEHSQPVEASEIFRDQKYQIRSVLKPSTFKKYAGEMAAGQRFPPLRLGRINGRLTLISGWNRFEAAVIVNGAEVVEVTIEDMGAAEAYWIAYEENRTHGEPLPTRAKRSGLSALIKAGRHKMPDGSYLPYRDLSRIIGAPHTTIRNWMKADHPYVFAALAKGDTQGRPDAGPPDPPDTDPETFRRAQQHLKDALDLCAALRCPGKRGELIGDALNTVVLMKELEHEEPEFGF